MNKALFLDRDGVINLDCGYPHKPEHIRFRDGIFELCKKALQHNYLIIVVTNQAGIARGYFKESDVEGLHEWMKLQFRSRGVIITDFYYCPYHPSATLQSYRKDSTFRKPGPGMILQAACEHNIDIERSIMIGDKESDRIKLPNLKSYILKSNYVESGYDVESLLDVQALLV
ncbi:HAD family hydrolase [Chitinispirillales bacterium ANBcel5]|uniref:D-glycero-alpha-D-manno-heptose-1,7-bisphosphate 7-phosphatase n=1 Tax=Cellulosispirillum alkaliphilum TaxID=3039283 RepID=UPI002A4EEE23|nr:HAD family hydrolase [Chitinispirillales bacterium ANBcel5]